MPPQVLAATRDPIVRRFALISLMVVVVVGVALAAQLTSVWRAENLAQAHKRALVTGRMLQHETHAHMAAMAAMAEDGRAGEHAAMTGMSGTQTLQERFARHLDLSEVLDVQLWAVDDNPPMGLALEQPDRVKSEAMQPAVTSAQPFSHIVTIGPDDDHHAMFGDAFTTYVPLQWAGDESPRAIVELLQDYEPTRAAIARGIRRVALVLVAGLLVLWGVMLPIVANVSRRLRDLVTEQEDHVRRLQDAEGVKNTFIEAVSHEMRTPLTSIIGMLQVLETKHAQLPPQQRQQLVHRAHANSRRLQRLMANLLDVDRLTRGVIKARRIPVRLDHLVHQTVGAVDVDHLDVTVDVEACIADVDPAQVERIIENLLVNAAKYTPAGSRAWLRLRNDDDGVVLIVEDDGPGIAEEDRERVFAAFERVHDLAHAPGTGVGLSLVQRFAQMHDGDAWVEDRHGGGAAFHVRFGLTGRERQEIMGNDHELLRQPVEVC